MNALAKTDLPSFRSLVFSLEKTNEGSHAKVGMKLPDQSDDSDIEYQHAMFKVLIRIFEKMFKELKEQRKKLFDQI